MKIFPPTALSSLPSLWQSAGLPSLGRWRPRQVLLAFAGVLILASIPWVQAQRSRSAILRAELATLEAQWATVAAQLGEAEIIKPKFTTLIEQPRRILAEQSAPRWTPALRAIIQGMTGEIHLRDITARQETGREAAYLLRLTGSATGGTPRIVADQFRQAIQRGLEEQHPGEVLTQFEGLEDAPPTPGSPTGAQAEFTITIRLGPGSLAAKGEPGT